LEEPVVMSFQSSSHLADNHGVKGALKAELPMPEFRVLFEAWGGRKWDKELINFYSEVQSKNHSDKKLHIIMLGDNDVRNTPIEMGVNPCIREFGVGVNALKKTIYNRDDTVFVNGLLPFLMLEKANNEDLISNYYRYTRELVNLTEYDDSIYFVPMRDPVLEFCRTRNTNLRSLFKVDGVHLSKLGEEFLINHLAHQARMYKAANGGCVDKWDLVFYRQSANRTRKDAKAFKYDCMEHELMLEDEGPPPRLTKKERKAIKASFKKRKVETQRLWDEHDARLAELQEEARIGNANENGHEIEDDEGIEVEAQPEPDPEGEAESKEIEEKTNDSSEDSNVVVEQTDDKNVPKTEA
jgi:lysophospholipase L1-like esterase